MRKLALLSVAVTLPAASPALAAQHHHRFKHHRECMTQQCADHADHLWAVHHPPPGQSGSIRLTHYSGPCDGQGTVFADGHSIYDPIDKHVLATYLIPMHAIVRFDRPVYGSRVWTVRDTGAVGHGDLYRPDCDYGPGWPGDSNPTVGYTVIGRARN